jgi:hypothetical protein
VVHGEGLAAPDTAYHRPVSGLRATASSQGVDWELELDRDGWLPGQLARGQLRLRSRQDIDARGIVIALIGTEQWQYDQTRTDSDGRSHTETVTRRDELRRVPVQLLGPTHFAEGDTRELEFEMPVPPLGPATLEATVSAMQWELEAKLDVPNGMDSAIVVAVRVLQPTALLRAGVVTVGQFALYEAADSAADEATATLELEPMPLCAGASFSGRLSLELERPMELQELRLELRVKVKATVSSGREETITAWVGRLAGAGELGAGSHVLELRGDLPPRDLPTVELPHGRTDAEFHVILARAWARDPHLVRDVAICTTTEI